MTSAATMNIINERLIAATALSLRLPRKIYLSINSTHLRSHKSANPHSSHFIANRSVSLLAKVGNADSVVTHKLAHRIT